MSRGHGTRQRAIIATLTRHAADHPPMADFDADGRLIAARYGFEHDHGLRDVPPSFLTADDLTDIATAAANEATKRAIRTLGKAGIIETCHGRNRKLGARIMPDAAIRDQWWLALADHQHIEWIESYYSNRLVHARAEHKHAFQQWDTDAAQKSIDFYAEKLGKSYRELRDEDTLLPSKQRERELERERRTAEQKADDDLGTAKLMADLTAVIGGDR